jgi:hypothetical protein
MNDDDFIDPRDYWKWRPRVIALARLEVYERRIQAELIRLLTLASTWLNNKIGGNH